MPYDSTQYEKSRVRFYRRKAFWQGWGAAVAVVLVIFLATFSFAAKHYQRGATETPSVKVPSTESLQRQVTSTEMQDSIDALKRLADGTQDAFVFAVFWGRVCDASYYFDNSIYADGRAGSPLEDYIGSAQEIYHRVVVPAHERATGKTATWEYGVYEVCRIAA